MQVQLTDKFTCYHGGRKLVFQEGDLAEGWPARRALAKGVAVLHQAPVVEEVQDESEDYED